MLRRYICVGIFFFLLVGAYFIFFFDKKDNTYNLYYEKLVNKEEYRDFIDGIDIEVNEICENEKYTYIVTFDNASEEFNNVKIMIVDENTILDYYPSFGIISNTGSSLGTNKEYKGINLTILDSAKIEYLLVYFASDNGEQYAKIKVSSYLTN